MSLPEQAQLALPVRLRDDATLDNFCAPEPVQPLLQALRQQASGEGEPLVFVFGPVGSGKSHLLQAACHLAGSDAVYLPLGEIGASRPEEVLQDVEHLALVCLDDLHRVLGDPGWELALFNLYNRARQLGCRLLAAADAAPRALAVSLPDLRSRLGWGPVFQLPAPSDQTRVGMLRLRASRRGLSLSPEVASYIISRAPRDPASLLALLDALDVSSLAEQRALSIPFVRKTLGW